MIRYYIAMYDDGHDYGSFTFSSEHRAGSKANMEDARNHVLRVLGYRRASQIEIIKIERYEVEKWSLKTH